MQREERVHSRHLGCAARSVRRVALPAMATSAPASLGTPYRGMDTPAWPMVSTATPHNVYWDGSEKSGSSYSGVARIQPLTGQAHCVCENICAKCSSNYGDVRGMLPQEFF